MSVNSLFGVLATTLQSGDQGDAEIIGRLQRVVGRKRWIPALVRRYLTAFDGTTRPRRRDVIRFLQDDESLLSALRGVDGNARTPRVREWIAEPQRMRPVTAASSWRVPAIETVGALAEWLGITVPELEWFADIKGRTSRDAASPLHHYHYRVVAKRRGGVRLIEAPQSRLKAMQRKILAKILDAVPTYYDAAHGFVKGRSIHTFAAPHVGQRLVLRLDIKDFFPSISGARVQAAFRTIGYPEAVADLLGAICTNVVPRTVLANAPAGVDARDVRAMYELRALYERPHLPQGAPTSPCRATASINSRPF